MNEPVQEQNHIQENPKQTSFGLDVLKLVSGTVIAQILSTLASPFLSRLFTPEAFGVFALFSSIVGILAAVFTLEYKLAIVLPKEDSDAANLFAGSMGIAILFSVLMIPVVWLFKSAFVEWLNAPGLAPYLWLLPPLLFFGGIGAGHPVLNAWASRSRHFAQISTTQVAGTLTTTISTLLAGFAGFNSGGGLIAGNLMGSVVSPVLLGVQIWKQNKKLFLESIHLSEILENLKRYRKFAIYNTPSTLLNTLSWQVPVFLLSAFFSPTIVGYYAFGNQLLRVPMNLIGGSIAQAFYSHAATAHNEGKLAQLVESTFHRLVEYSFFPILMLAVIGRPLCVVVFGEQWAEAGIYTQILSLWMVFWFISSPMARLFSVLEMNEFPFWANVVYLITRVISIWIGGVLGDPRLALILFSITGALASGYVTMYIIHSAGVPWKNIRSIFFKNIAIFIPAGGVIMVLILLGVSDLIQLVVAALLVVGYFVYRFKDEIQLKLVITNFIRKFLRAK